MTDRRFKTVFSGELMPDTSLETVKDNLARPFKSEPGKTDALLGGRPVVLKRELPETEAERYLTTLRQAGANAYKEVGLVVSLGLVETPNHNPQVAEETPAQNLPPMICPKYGHKQPSGAKCSARSIIIKKYLARQAQLGENVVLAAVTGAGAGTSPYTPLSARVGEALPGFGELNVFITNGRIGRLRYLGWSMAMVLCFLVIMGLDFLLGETVGVAVTALASIAFIVIAVMIGVQRLYDLGWSGWLRLLNFVPFVGSVFSILMLILPGSTGTNRYGPPPPTNSTGVKVLVGLIILLPMVGVITAIVLPSYQGYLECANYDDGASVPADLYITGERAATAAAEADEAATAAAEAMKDDDQQQPRNPSRRAGSSSPSVSEKSRMPRCALITGASSGIGLALAEVLARRGRTLILVARQRDASESIACELAQCSGVEVLFRTCDLSEPLQLSGLLYELEQGERQIDLLVNNAGIGASGLFIDQEWVREQELIELDILALARLCHSLGARMTAQGGGQILNIASVAASQPGAWMNNYYASRAYVLHFSEGLREKLKGRGIKVPVLCPGPTRTEFFREAGMRLGRLDRSKLVVTPEEVVSLALRGLDKNRALVAPG